MLPSTRITVVIFKSDFKKFNFDKIIHLNLKVSHATMFSLIIDVIFITACTYYAVRIELCDFLVLFYTSINIFVALILYIFY